MQMVNTSIYTHTSRCKYQYSLSTIRVINYIEVLQVQKCVPGVRRVQSIANFPHFQMPQSTSNANNSANSWLLQRQLIELVISCRKSNNILCQVVGIKKINK